MAEPEVALEADHSGNRDGRHRVRPVDGARGLVRLRGGYTTHGYIYAASVAVVMVLAPVGMYLMGIRDEEGLR